MSRYENKALRDLARGAPCMFSFSGCDRTGETSVWVHSDESDHGKGMGIKAHDYYGAIGCGNCHSKLPNLPREWRETQMTDAMERTWAYLWEQGLVQVAGSVPHGTARKANQKTLASVRIPKIIKHSGVMRR